VGPLQIVSPYEKRAGRWIRSSCAGRREANEDAAHRARAADRLGVGYSTLKQWIYDGKVRTVRTSGGHHRIAEIEVDRLLLSQPAPDARLRGTLGVFVALSGRNQLRGVVEEVRQDGLLAQVRLNIGASGSPR